ncbi:MAG: DUF87 domain-containing protein [Ruminococcus sp.]|nr:DUF87 domain-containing protein [Ruminococcus sp.]
MIHKFKSKIKIPYLINGCKKIWNKKYRILFPLIFLIAVCCSWFAIDQNIHSITIEWLETFLLWIISGLMIAFIIIGELLIVSLIGTPLSATRVQKCLASVGFTDKAGKTPLLVSRFKDGKAEVFEFYSPTIPLKEYEKKSIIENAMNIQIVDITVGNDLQHIQLKTVPAKNKLPDKIEWDNSLLSKKTSELILGESLLDTVSVDLDISPHILIGGSTGSGKSVLFKLMLAQCIQKGFDVYIADFKGGVDFNGQWREKAEVFTNARIGIEEARKKLLKRLTYLENELDTRIALFDKYKCKDIIQYNKKFNCNLQRIVFGCDEIAELLDKTGFDKDNKAVVAQIESKISLLARQGRAFGIHLIFATQRPDSEILKGQIKNNFDIRICGRADKVLSQIILDTPEAAEKIPKDKQGVFLTNTGVLFKAYYLNEDYMF